MRLLLCLSILFAALGVARAADDASPRDPEIQRMVSEISADRIERSIHILTSFKTRHSLSDPSPGGNGIGAARAWIRAELERASADSGGRLKVDLDAFEQPAMPPAIPRKTEMVNIVATLPGTQSDSRGRLYVVCAHYDSRAADLRDADSPAPGADDNASGIAALLELARVMSHYDFDATIVFLATAGGEQGRVGSTHWAEQARKSGLNIAGVFNIDAIGHNPGSGDAPTVKLFCQGVPPQTKPDHDWLVQIQAGGENDFPPRQLARAIKEAAALYVPSLNVKLAYRADRDEENGDQRSFLERAWPAVRLSEVGNADLVASADTPDRIDFPYIAGITRINVAALAVLARAPAVPRDVQIVSGPPPAGDITLRWMPSREPNLAAYRIIWRDTTSSVWEHSLDAPKGATSFTMRDVAAEDSIFGLEAVDAAGHASPAAYALPRAAR